MAPWLHPKIKVFQRGSDTCEIKPRLISDINACMAVADVVRTTFGTRGGMDKLPFEYTDRSTITHDGHDLHFAAYLLVYIAKSVESEIGGDVGTAIILLAGEFLKEAKLLFEDNEINHHNVLNIFRRASTFATEKINMSAVSIGGKSLKEKKNFLVKCAYKTLSSKLIGGEKEFFATMVVDAVLANGNKDGLNMIGMKKVPGGTMRDSFFVNGIAFKAPKRAEPERLIFSDADFKQRPKKFLNPKILLLNIELPPMLNGDIWFSKDQCMFNMFECVKSGAKVVLSQFAIGDEAAAFFAEFDIFCVDHVAEKDLHWVAAATGGTVQTSVIYIADEVLGSCDVFEEKQVGNERFNIFTGCPSDRTATIVLRGCDEFIEEAERSLHDAIEAVRRALKISHVVAGGGAIEMEISKKLKQHAHTLDSTSQRVLNCYANALEVVPRQLCDNAGFDATEVLNKLRKKHALPSGQGKPYGVDMDTGGIADSFANFMWEQADSKAYAIHAATDAVCLLFSV